MHDSHFPWRTDRPPHSQPCSGATQTFRRTALFAWPQKTQDAKDIVADSLHPQGHTRKLTTGFSAAIIAATLAACAPAGDFGRPHLDLAPLGSTIAADSRAQGWWYTDSPPHFTEDERELRNRTWHFLDRKRPLWQKAEPEFEVADYYLRLVKRRPPDAAWAKLLDDVRTDIPLAEAFLIVAARVQKTDRLRAAALDRPTQANMDASDDLVKRLAENAGLVGAVEEALRNRIAGYEYAADRLATEAPDAAEKKVRVAIRSLARTLARKPEPRVADPVVIRAD
jgi:hypothetical protein